LIYQKKNRDWFYPDPILAPYEALIAGNMGIGAVNLKLKNYNVKLKFKNQNYLIQPK